VFADRLPLAERFAHLLATEGVLRGLIGPREAPRLWERHLLNCAVVAELVPRDVTVADLGSGAGLPGLVLALLRPDLEVTLVEPLLRRTSFLAQAVRDLELAQVRVVRTRAEELHGKERFDVVTSRALAPLERLLTWSVPLTRPGGAVLAIKGSSAAAEVASCTALVTELGAEPAEVLVCGRDLIDPPTTVVRVAVTARADLGWRDARGPRPRRRAPRRGTTTGGA
jgi:16S rRNA (guanine527-N7)-methyltransferase